MGIIYQNDDKMQFNLLVSCSEQIENNALDNRKNGYQIYSRYQDFLKSIKEAEETKKRNLPVYSFLNTGERNVLAEIEEQYNFNIKDAKRRFFKLGVYPLLKDKIVGLEEELSNFKITAYNDKLESVSLLKNLSKDAKTVKISFNVNEDSYVLIFTEDHKYSCCKVIR